MTKDQKKPEAVQNMNESLEQPSAYPHVNTEATATMPVGVPAPSQETEQGIPQKYQDFAKALVKLAKGANIREFSIEARAWDGQSAGTLTVVWPSVGRARCRISLEKTSCIDLTEVQL